MSLGRVVTMTTTDTIDPNDQMSYFIKHIAVHLNAVEKMCSDAGISFLTAVSLTHEGNPGMAVGMNILPEDPCALRLQASSKLVLPSGADEDSDEDEDSPPPFTNEGSTWQ